MEVWRRKRGRCQVRGGCERGRCRGGTAMMRGCQEGGGPRMGSEARRGCCALVDAVRTGAVMGIGVVPQAKRALGPGEVARLGESGTGFHDEWSTVWGGVWEGASPAREAVRRRAGWVSRAEAPATLDARGGAGVGRIERRRFGGRPPDPLRGPRQRAGDSLGAKACVAPASDGTAQAWPQPRGVRSSAEAASSSSRRSFSRARARLASNARTSPTLGSREGWSASAR